jgi:hypothetical protein
MALWFGAFGYGAHPPIPNPQSPIPNPQSPRLYKYFIYYILIINFIIAKIHFNNKIILKNKFNELFN